jgi:hypothetical protein
VWPVLVAVLGVAAVAIVAGGYFGWQWTQGQFFVGARGDEVVVFQGIQQEVGPFQFFEVAKHTGKPLSKLSAPDQALVKDGFPVTTVAEGLTRINDLNFTTDATPPADASPSPTSSSDAASPKPNSAKPTTTKTKSP